MYIYKHVHTNICIHIYIYAHVYTHTLPTVSALKPRKAWSSKAKGCSTLFKRAGLARSFCSTFSTRCLRTSQQSSASPPSRPNKSSNATRDSWTETLKQTYVVPSGEVIHLPFPGLFVVTLTVLRAQLCSSMQADKVLMRMLLDLARYFACFAFFALFWIWFSDVCDIGLNSYRDAFYLSVETQMTIGYGPIPALWDDTT